MGLCGSNSPLVAACMALPSVPPAQPGICQCAALGAGLTTNGGTGSGAGADACRNACRTHLSVLADVTRFSSAAQSIDALSDALEAFEGGVVIISHDAQLLSRVCDETSEVRPHSTTIQSKQQRKPMCSCFCGTNTTRTQEWACLATPSSYASCVALCG